MSEHESRYKFISYNEIKKRSGYQSLLGTVNDEHDLLNEEEITELDLKISSDWFDTLKWLKPAVCECGGEKANTTHAYYCPKHEEF